MASVPSWADEIAPRYFFLKSEGYTDDEACEVVKGEFEDILEGHGAARISRVMRAFRQDLVSKVPGGAVTAPQFQVPPPPGHATASPLVGLEVPYEDCHIWNDVHVPYHIPELVEKSLNMAYADGVGCLVIGGDFMDMKWASRFTSWGKASPLDVEQEFVIVRQIIGHALDVFDKIYIIPGNHDGTRFKYMSGGSVGFRQVMNMALGPHAGAIDKRIIVGEKRWMVLKDSPWGDWRITHPEGVRAVPLSLAQALALKTGQNIITAHQHYLGVSFDRYGKYILVDGGHMQDEELADYKQETDTTHSAWSPGFVTLKDGWPNIYAHRGG